MYSEREQSQLLWFPVDESVGLAGSAHSRGVDNGENILYVLLQDSVE